MAWWIKNRGKVFLRNHQWRRNLNAWCPFQLKPNIKFIIALTRESLFLLFDWLNVWGHQNCEWVMKYCFLQFIAGGCPQSVKTCFKIPLIQLNCSVFHIQLVYRKTTCLCPHNRTFPAPKKQKAECIRISGLFKEVLPRREVQEIFFHTSSKITHWPCTTPGEILILKAGKCTLLFNKETVLFRYSCSNSTKRETLHQEIG